MTNTIIRATETYNPKTGVTISAKRNPTREELVAEAKAVFSDPKRAVSLIQVERIKDSRTGTTVSITGYPKYNPYLVSYDMPHPSCSNTKILLIPGTNKVPKSIVEKLFSNFSFQELMSLKPKDFYKVYLEGLSSATKDVLKLFRYVK